jgi:NAD(P)-dependent dehydrogenase (short-subunit alcohol dehydrogenase family)
MKDFLDLNGKQILIAGGAKGIGRETGKVLSQYGAKIIMLDIDSLELVKALKSFAGIGHSGLQFDLSNVNGIEELIASVVKENGPFDGFVFTVGVRSRRPLSLTSPKILNEILNVNFTSFVEIVRNITKKKNFNKGLSIVGISSISSQVGHQSVTAYAASKAALDSAVRCLAKELSKKNIRLNTVVPSTINTHVYKEFVSSQGKSDQHNGLFERQYLGIGEPVDVANVIAFLLSNSSKFITGSAIPIDGGYLT